MPRDMIDNSNTLMVLLGGNTFDYANPSSDDVFGEDCIRAMSHLPAWNGQVEFDGFYSIGQRALIMSYVAQDLYGDEMARAAFIRYSAFTYSGGIPRPLLKFMPDLARLVIEITQVIYDRLGVDFSLFNCPEMLSLERQMFAIEHRDMRPAVISLTLPEPDSSIIIAPMSTKMVEKALCERYYDLWERNRVLGKI